MHLPRLEGFYKPLPVGVVDVGADLLVLCPIFGTGDIPGNLVTLVIGDIEELDKGVLLLDLLQEGLLTSGIHSLYGGIVYHLLDKVSGHLIGPLFDQIEIGDKEFGEIFAGSLFHLLGGDIGSPPLVIFILDPFI